MVSRLSRSWRTAAVPLAGALALLLAACGGPSTGDVEGQVLAMRDAAQQPVLLTGATAILAGNRIDCGKRTDDCAGQTDAQGRYAFKDIPTGDYGVAFSTPSREGEVRLQPESRQFNVSRGSVETVSVVLLADGIAKPAVPAELQQRGAQARNDPGLTSNPFFWYFMFNQPWLGGYSRPPVVVYAPGTERTIVMDQRQAQSPAVPGRTYTSYAPAGSATGSTKPAPQVIESKGVTRPGGSAALPSTAAEPVLPSSSASKGVARPGQGLSGASSSSSSSSASRPSTGSSGSSSAPSPPRVGAGGGSTAGRAPSSSSGRSVSPPRVSGGRR